MKVLLTGAAGFIGFHVGLALARRGDTVIGIDNLNDYYDVRLKEARRDILEAEKGVKFIKADIADREAMETIFAAEKPARVVHLAAQAGVRYGVVNPNAYINSNITGFLHVLEGCRHNGVKHLVYASSFPGPDELFFIDKFYYPPPKPSNSSRERWLNSSHEANRTW